MHVLPKKKKKKKKKKQPASIRLDGYNFVKDLGRRVNPSWHLGFGDPLSQLTKGSLFIEGFLEEI
jgi:hypothetical protein